MSNSIFKSASNDLKNLLAICKPEQLLYAPIDVAKYNHSAMIVNLLGEIIIPKFDFPYNLHGIDFLKNKLQSACDISQAKKLSQGIPPRPQILALESTGHYHENLVASLSLSGYDITIIRPIDSKNERDNAHAKTDAIDLAAIAKVIISNKGTRSNMPDTVYYNLQRASRTHRQLTWQETRVKNIITMLVDKTFTGLWNPDNAIFSDKWGKASLLFVSQYPTPQQAIKMGARRLSELGSRGYPLRTANRFIKLAYSMMKNETLYCPKTGNPLTTLDEYYQSAWSKVKEKLTDYLSDDIPQDNYLVKIQHQLGEKYGIT